MRNFRIFLLHCQQILEYKLRCFIWFLSPIQNCLILILFWLGVFSGQKQIAGWTMGSITAYYFLLTIASSMLNSHIEGDVSEFDIKKGDLVRYLLQPYPYFWRKFFEEMPWRVLQGSYGIILLTGSILIFGNFLQLNINLLNLICSLIMIILAYFISFTYKMNLGFTSFWFEDARGFHQLLEVIAIILCGEVVPLTLAPKYVQQIANLTPFPYIIYYPVTVFQGKYILTDMLKIISVQLFWLSALLILKEILWKKGIKSFTATGQ